MKPTREERMEAILQILTWAVADGAVCPTYVDIAKHLGCSADSVRKDMDRLHATGQITMEAVNGGKVIEIDGRRTAAVKPRKPEPAQDGAVVFHARAMGREIARFLALFGRTSERFEDVRVKPAPRRNYQPIPARSGGGYASYGA